MGNFVFGMFFGILVSTVVMDKVVEYVDSGVTVTKEFINERVADKL